VLDLLVIRRPDWGSCDCLLIPWPGNSHQIPISSLLLHLIRIVLSSLSLQG
jgi:hypothetical protein